MVYDPHEDSFLLKTFVHRLAKGVVLDMGTGSGIQAVEASHRKRVKEVYAVDIDPKAIAYCKKYNDKNKHTKVKWLVGDLFEPLKPEHQFDTIIFNAPYLPQEHKLRDIQLEGGRKGHETIQRFMEQASDYLKIDGTILLVFSSLTPFVHEIIEKNMYDGKELGERHMFFESIYVYLLKKNDVRKQLEKNGVKNIHYYTKGKRGLIFTGDYKKKKVAIKLRHPKSTAMSTVTKEAKMMQDVNRAGIGPKYLFHTPKFIVYEFVDGVHFPEVKKNVKKIAKEILKQCFQLDLMHITKKEMTRPLKNVIVKGNNVTLIDFERARKDKATRNVTQFCQFIGNNIDRKNKKKWIAIAREYSKDPSKKVLNKMVAML